jgi:hypothetical protein
VPILARGKLVAVLDRDSGELAAEGAGGASSVPPSDEVDRRGVGTAMPAGPPERRRTSPVGSIAELLGTLAW